MVNKRSVKDQLHHSGFRYRIFGRSEANELANIINSDETIIHCVYGHYHGGSGLIVATDSRVILVDKRAFYLNVESMPFENIRDIDFGSNMLQGILYMHYGTKRIVFRSISDAHLRKLKDYVSAKLDNISALAGSFQEPLQRPAKKQYQNPAWRPHHITMLPRSRNTKYHKL